MRAAEAAGDLRIARGSQPPVVDPRGNALSARPYGSVQVRNAAWSPPLLLEAFLLDVSSSVNYEMENLSIPKGALTVLTSGALMGAPSDIGRDSRAVPVFGPISISRLRIDWMVNRQDLFVAVFPAVAEVGCKRLRQAD